MRSYVALRACVIIDLLNEHLICFEERTLIITQLSKGPTGQLRKSHFRFGHQRRRTFQKPIGQFTLNCSDRFGMNFVNYPLIGDLRNNTVHQMRSKGRHITGL